jgi:hypothetical protein
MLIEAVIQAKTRGDIEIMMATRQNRVYNVTRGRFFTSKWRKVIVSVRFAEGELSSMTNVHKDTGEN